MGFVATAPNRQRGRNEGFPRRTNYHSRLTQLFLIASLPIRIACNSNPLNKKSISNRQKKGIFQLPVTYNPIPASCRSNRNCKELKIDVSHCKQRPATGSNRNSPRRKAKGETSRHP